MPNLTSRISSSGSLIYEWKGTYEERVLAEEANFTFRKGSGGVWYTKSPYRALKLIDYVDDAQTYRGLLLPLERIEASRETVSFFDVPLPPVTLDNGDDLMSFQKVGVENSIDRWGGKKDNINLIGDEMGVGKTIQVIGVSNKIGAERILVICPASLREKWRREMEKWHITRRNASLVSGSKYIFNPHLSYIVSYEGAVAHHIQLIEQEFDHIIIDECHYLKNPDAQRTQKILGATYTKHGLQNEGDKGIIDVGEKIDLLSGTPIPNRPHEFHPILRKCAPDSIDHVGYWRYLERFCKFYHGNRGVIVTGTRNEWELYNRLRGSGFMTRRLKKDVLTELPDKVYNLIYFPSNSKFAKILEKEKPFSVEEIRSVGVDNISGLPDVRREMGEAKVPLIIQYVDMLLKTIDKVIVGAWHKNVIEELFYAYCEKGCNPAGIYGATVHRQAQVDKFQMEPECRVFIGQLQAAGEGHDLTASSHVVLAEPDWAPMRNNQFIDRLHRIGQTEKVTVHIPVVEGSLDAKIFSVATDKQWGSDKILDGEM